MTEALLKVLLVEDNPGDAVLVRAFLEQSVTTQFELKVAGRLDTALDMLEASVFDVVLLDMSLPDATGLSIVTRTRTVRSDLPILVLTGRDDEELALSALREGAQDYLRKVDMDERLLERAIRYAIERNQVERELQKAKDAAEAAMRAKANFLASVSHEIRTPINTIITMSGLLARRDLPPDSRKYVDAVESSSQTLREMVNDILDLSKIEAGGLTLERVSFALLPSLEGMLKALGSWAESEGLAFGYEVDDSVPRNLLGDPLRLRQIVVNLVSNAVKFTSVGEVRVLIEAETADLPDVVLRVSVSDTGAGIPKDKLDAIFNAFSQVDESTTRLHGGTGLGLAICSQLVQLMDGEITVRSEEGAGSTFSFTARLRAHLAPSSDGEDPLGADGKVEVRGEPIELPSLRILLVDDLRFNLMAAKELLEEEGHSVTPVKRARVAIEALQTESFDLVLMDVRMPEMDGYEATRQIRLAEKTTGAHVPIVGLTAESTADDEKACLEAGMDGYVAKPIQIGSLLTVVASVLGRQTGSFDVEAALSQVDGNEELLRKLVELFFEDCPKHLAAIEAAINNGDASALADEAHGMKGSLKMLALKEPLDPVNELEEMGKSGDLSAARDSLDCLKQRIAKLNPVLVAFAERTAQ